MAKNAGKKACCIVATIPLLFLSIALFVVLLGLGAWGIVEAQVENPCAARDNITMVNGCEPALSLLSSSPPEGSTSPPGEAVVRLVHVGWTYWLGGATGVGVIWAIVQTFTGVALIATIALFDEDKDSSKVAKSSSKEEIPMRNLRAGSTEHTDGGGDDEDSGDIIDQQTITIGGGVVKKEGLSSKSVRPLTVGAAFGLFISLFFFVVAVLCLLWAIAISYDHARRDDGSVATYVVVEFIAAIALPICLFVCGILMASVLDFITRGQVDLRQFIPKFLPVVKFETGTNSKGETHDYWVIEDTFYFEVPKHNHEKNNFLCSLDRSSSTWFLNGIVCLGIHLAVAYFVDFTLDTQTTIQSPDRCDTIDSTFQCFVAGNLSNTRCGSEYFNGTIHCFKFLRFGVDFDLIMAVSTSYAFYLVASTAFTYLFSVVKIILHIKPSKWWGLGFLFAGILAFIGGIILAIVWFYGYAAAQVEEILHFNIINLGQYFMVCAYIMMVGLLLVVAKWWENVDVPHHKPTIKKELVHYHDAARGDVEKAANEHAAELARRSPDVKA